MIMPGPDLRVSTRSLEGDEQLRLEAFIRDDQDELSVPETILPADLYAVIVKLSAALFNPAAKHSSRALPPTPVCAGGPSKGKLEAEDSAPGDSHKKSKDTKYDKRDNYFFRSLISKSVEH